MKCKAIFAGLCAAPLLAGCATYGSASTGKFDPEAFGEANRQTYAAMIVNPDPQYDEDMPGNAEKAADAIERYREDQVKKPAAQSTTGGPG